jgi:hypothetical protein
MAQEASKEAYIVKPIDYMKLAKKIGCHHPHLLPVVCWSKRKGLTHPRRTQSHQGAGRGEAEQEGRQHAIRLLRMGTSSHEKTTSSLTVRRLYTRRERRDKTEAAKARAGASPVP